MRAQQASFLGIFCVRASVWGPRSLPVRLQLSCSRSRSLTVESVLSPTSTLTSKYDE